MFPGTRLPEKGPTTGSIIGAIIGVIVLLAIIGTAIAMYRKHRNNKLNGEWVTSLSALTTSGCCYRIRTLFHSLEFLPPIFMAHQTTVCVFQWSTQVQAPSSKEDQQCQQGESPSKLEVAVFLSIILWDTVSSKTGSLFNLIVCMQICVSGLILSYGQIPSSVSSNLNPLPLACKSTETGRNKNTGLD